MASLIPNSFIRDVITGAIDLDTDTFKVMLLTSAYVPNKDTHTKRSDLTNEVVGTGYTAGGAAAAFTVAAVDTVNDDVEVTLGGSTWATATITARYAVYYKSRGGAASADELVYVNDFGSDVTSTGANFALASSLIKFQN